MTTPIDEAPASPVLGVAIAKARGIPEDKWPWLCKVKRHRLDSHSGEEMDWCYDCRQSIDQGGNA